MLLYLGPLASAHSGVVNELNPGDIVWVWVDLSLLGVMILHGKVFERDYDILAKSLDVNVGGFFPDGVELPVNCAVLFRHQLKKLLLVDYLVFVGVNASEMFPHIEVIVGVVAARVKINERG